MLTRSVMNLRAQAARSAHQRRLTRVKSTAAAASASSADDKIRELSEVKGPGWWWLPRLVNRDLLSNFGKLYNDYADEGVVRVRTPKGEIALVIFDQDDIKHVYQNEGRDVKGSSDTVWPLQKYFRDRDGDSPNNHALNIHLSGDTWRHTRNILSPGINTDAVAAYEPLVHEAATAAVSHIEHYAPDELAKWAQFAAFDMFTSLAIGENPETSDPACTSPMTEIVSLDEKTLGTAALLSFTPWFMHPRNGYETMKEGLDRAMDVTCPVIDRIFDQSTVPSSWFKDLRNDQGLTREDLKPLMGNLLLFGVGTTMSLIQWIMVALAFHREEQNKIRAEILEKMGEKPFTKSVKMPYMEAFFREANRMYPVSPGTSLRTLDHDIVLPSSRVRVPAGTAMQLFPIFQARDSRFNSDAGEFKPERYLRENVRARKGCPMTSKLDPPIGKDPFGGGARVCLGKRAAELEVRTLVCEILRKYELVLDPVEQAPPKTKMSTIVVPDPFPRIKVVRL